MNTSLRFRLFLAGGVALLLPLALSLDAQNGSPVILIGAGEGGGMARELRLADGSEVASGMPWGPAFTGGVRVAVGDVNGDALPDRIVGSGPGAGQIRVYSGQDASILASFSPFGGSFTGGVYVAAGDVNADGRADLIAGAGLGGGNVIVLSGGDGLPLASGFPFTSLYTGGVTVAAGDINGDGRADIIAGTAIGGAVRVLSGLGATDLAGGFPYGPLFLGGVNVAAGDVNGDGRVDIVTAPRTVGGLVRVFSGLDISVLADVTPFPSVGGVTVAAGDVNGDGRADLITGSGAGGPPRVRVFDAASLSELANFMALSPTFTGGVFVATVSNGIGPLRFTSAPAGTLTAGQPGTFAVTTSAGPGTTITMTGAVPSGVSFIDDGNGTARLHGTPAPGTGGTYPLTFSAARGGAPLATQSFVLTIREAPAFTSANTTEFGVNRSGAFRVTTRGFPRATLTSTGGWPSGVTFADQGDGTALLTGIAPATGVFISTITATSALGDSASQVFSLTVSEVPTGGGGPGPPGPPPPPSPPGADVVFTSVPSATWTVGSAASFLITTSSAPTAHLITFTGALPSGITFTNNGDGTATLSGTPPAGSTGTYPLLLTGINSVGTAGLQKLTLTINNSRTPIITSPTGAIFTVGAGGTFTVTTTAVPAVTSITSSGALPAGVTFVDHGNGTATLGGTPAPGTEGAYPLTFSASNGSPTAGTQSFTLTVHAPSGGRPTITSANTTTFVVDSASAFTVTTTGTPTATTIGVSGALPGGVTFTNNSDGTATLSGMPVAGTAGSYALVFSATNSNGTATQPFTLIVNNLTTTPTFTSATSTTFRIGAPGTFAVTTAAEPPVTAITLTGTPPAGVSFTDNGNGTATLGGTPTAGPGPHVFTFNATNGGVWVTQIFTVTVQQTAAVTSANGTTFTAGLPGTFTMTTIGTPIPTLAHTGALPSGVTFTANPDGTATLAGTAATGTAGTYPVMLTATNGVGTAGQQTFTLTVNGNNPPTLDPIANPAPIAEDAALQTVNFQGITAGTGETQTMVLTATSNNSALIPNPAVTYTSPNTTGSLTYTPVANISGTAVITVTVTDNGFDNTPGNGDDAQFSQTFTVTVNPINDAPTLAVIPNPAAINEDAPLQTVNLNGITAGPVESQPLQLTAVSDNTALIPNPTVIYTSPNATGSLTYTLVANANGTATITVTVRDGGLDLDLNTAGDNLLTTQTFMVTVTAVNDPPTFVKGADQADLEDTGLHTVNGWATAISAGPADEVTAGQTTSFSITNNTNTALFAVTPQVSATGDLTYTLATDISGTSTITVRLTDNGGTANGGVDFSEQTFVIGTTNVNDAPSFTKGADQTVLEDAGAQTVNGWATAISAGPNEGTQTVSFEITTNSNGALFAAGPLVSPAGTLTYTPATHANGTADITLRITDNGGTANGGVDVSTTQTFNITITAVNDVPSFTKGADVTVAEDSGISTTPNWATAISAGPNEGTQTVTFAVTNNTNTALFATLPAVQSNGTLSFRPADNVFGTATITLRLDDSGDTSNGGVNQSATQSVVITVTNVNDLPSFTKGADQTLLEDAAGTQTVAGWATAINPGINETDAVTFNVSNNNNGLFSAQPAVAANGTLTYTLAANQNGSATVSVSLTDDGMTPGVPGDDLTTTPAQTFTITVTPVNDAPSFVKGANVTVNEESGLSTSAGWATAISAGPTADETGQTLTFNVNNDNTTLFSGQPAIAANGTLTFTPAANRFGTATVTVTLSDNGSTANGGADTSGPQTFDIIVTNVNDMPSFTKGADQTVLEDAVGMQSTANWATLINPGTNETDLLAFNVSNNNTGLFSVQPAVAANGTLTYALATNQNGVATVSVTLTDDGMTPGVPVDDLTTTPAQTFTITVTAVNDAPSFTKGANVTVAEESGGFSQLNWATLISAGPTADEAGQTLTFNVTGNTNPGIFAGGGAPAVSPSGELTFTPGLNAFGTTTITLTLSDNGLTANGGADTSAGQTFTITINNVNDAPTANPDTPSTTEDAVLNLPAPGVLTNDTDPDVGVDTKTVVLVNGAANVGTPIVTGDGATLTLNADGSLVYNGTAVPAFQALNVGQSDTDAFTYTMQDAAAAQSATTVTVTINGVNDAPALDLDLSGAGTGYAVAFTDGDPAQLIVDAVDATITDVDNATLSSLTITLTNLLDPGFETLSANLAGLPNLNQVYNTATPGVGVLTISGATPQPIADFITALRTVRYLNTDDNPDTLPRTIQFVANDGAANSNTAVATVTIVPQDDAPTGGADSYGVNEGGTLNIAAPGVLGNDQDPEGNALTATIVVASGPTNASSFVLNANGSVDYTHNGSETTTDSFQYRANANGLQSAPVTVTITITPQNDAPTAVADTGATNENTILNPAAPGVLGNDTDPDVGDTKTVVLLNGAANLGPITTTDGATLTINANGSYTYDPTGSATLQALAGGATEIDSFTYTMQDAAAVQSTATVDITVTGVNDAPVLAAGGGSPSYTEDAAPVAVATALTVTDVDDANLESATITVTNVQDAGLETLAAPTLLGGAGANFTTPGGVPTLTISGSTTKANYETMLRAVTYANSSQAPNTTARTVQFVVSDGDVTSNAVTKSVAVVSVNDAPQIAGAGGTFLFTEAQGATVIDNSLTVTDADHANIASATVAITGNYQAGQDFLALPVTPGISSNFAAGTLTLSGSATKAAYEAALETVTYNNTSNNPSELQRTITWIVNDGTDPSVGVTSFIDVDAINSAPNGVADAWTTFGNTELRVDTGTTATPHVLDTTTTTFGVLDNDSDVEGDPLSVTGLVGAGCGAGVMTCATAGGGTATIQSNGRFNYTPQAGDVTSDSFQYLLSDGLASVQVTVNLTLNERIWYVNGAVAGPGSGLSNDPFKDLPAAPGDADDYIFVHNSAVTGAITLQQGQKLYGEGQGLSINQNLNGNGASNLVAAGSNPTVSTNSANTVAVSATAGNRTAIEIRGVTLATTAASSNAIDVTSSGANNVGVTISNVTITGATAEGIDVNHGSSGTGTVALSNISVTSTGTGIDLNESAAGALTITAFSDLNINGTTGGSGIVVTNATFDATVGGSYNQVAGGTTTVGASGNPVGAGGVVLTNVTGDLAFTDLDIYSGGGNGGLFVTSTGALNASAPSGMRVAVASGVATFESAGGPVVDVNNATIDLPLSSATVTSSGTTGISLASVSDGTDPVVPAVFSATSGSIANTTGVSFSVNGGNATISYGGSITQGNNAATVSVVGPDSNSVTISGTVNATNGSGLQFTDADGSYTFSGTTTLNGGGTADTGIDITGGSNGTFAFGGTTITNPTGVAFNVDTATGGITITGAISKNTDGRLIDFSNYDTATATLSGNLSCTAACDGIEVTNNGSAGTVTFSGGTKTLNTSAGAITAVNLDTNTGGTVNFNGGGLAITTSSGIGFNAIGGGTVNITTGGNANTISTTTGQAVVMSGVAVGSSNMTLASIAVSGSPSSANALSFTTVTGNTFSGGNVTVAGTTTSGDGIEINGSSATFSFASATIDSTAGAGINLTGANGSVTFTTVDIDGTAGVGIAVTNNTNSVLIDAGSIGSSNDPAGIGVDISSGSGNITVDATINKTTAGDVVEITGRTAGTVDFNGNITSSVASGGGIDINTNTGGTVRFDGGMSLSTGTAAAFNASNASLAGTLVVTDPGAGSNILTTTTGTALNVSNMNIGSEDLTFLSISASGAVNGIVLNNTGASGGLTVTGNGTTTVGGDNSGGTIQNTTGFGISLTSTFDPSFTNVRVQTTAGHGVGGTDVTNFTYQYGRIDDSNTDALTTSEEASIGFYVNETNSTRNNLDGVVSIVGNQLTNAQFHGIDIFNFSGTISSITISNNTITSDTAAANSQGSGIRLIAFGSATTIANITAATISGNDVNNFPSGAGIQVQGGNGNLAGPATGFVGHVGSVTDIINITDNDVSGASAANRIGTFGIAAVVNGLGEGNFLIGDGADGGTVGNLVSNTIGSGISVGSFGFANVFARINDNVLNTNNQSAAAGIGAGTSATLTLGTETPTLTVYLERNDISNNDGNGILVTARDSSSTVNAHILNNIVDAPLSGNRPGIRIDSGNNISGDETVNLEISGNTAAGSGLVPEGIGFRKQGSVSTTNAFNIYDAPGGASLVTNPSNAQVATFVNSLNPAANGTFFVTNDTGYQPTTTLPPLLAADGLAPVMVAAAAPLTPSDAAAAFAAARARWQSRLSARQQRMLDGVSIVVEDLPGARLGEARGTTIVLDTTAAGWGWFVDPTPLEDAEFEAGTRSRGAADRIDLLTAVLHEMLHVLDQPDLDAARYPDDVMAGTLPRGVRRMMLRSINSTDAPAVTESQATRPGTVARPRVGLGKSKSR